MLTLVKNLFKTSDVSKKEVISETGMVTFGEQFNVVLPDGLIEEDGIVEIQKLLSSWDLPELPDDWDWQAVVEHKKYSGTFSKRARKYYHEKCIKLTHSQCSELGSLVGQYSSRNASYVIRFTSELWSCGAYHDAGSCFWGDKKFAPDIIFGEGGGGVLFYDDADNRLGRCWILPYRDDWVIFNAYGLPLLTMARALSQFLVSTYRRIDLRNNYSTDGHLHINDDGYILFKEEDKYIMDQPIDLRIDESKYVVYCEDCGEIIDEKNVINDEVYCNDCASNFEECYYCSEMSKDYDTINNKTVCQNCMSDVYECEHCQDRNHRDDMVILKGVGWVCDMCSDEYIECPHCSKYHDRD